MLLLAAYVVVARQLMLLVPDYRQELEAVLEEHLGFAIVIEQLDGSMDGLTPRFEVRGLTLPHAEGEPALRLDQVSASVSILPTLFHRDLYLRELRIKGVDVHLVRGEDGGIRLRGLEALQDREQGDPAVQPGQIQRPVPRFGQPLVQALAVDVQIAARIEPVSYTHLTLPTKA